MGVGKSRNINKLFLYGSNERRADKKRFRNGYLRSIKRIGEVQDMEKDDRHVIITEGEEETFYEYIPEDLYPED